jgi:hypothetical protein
MGGVFREGFGFPQAGKVYRMQAVWYGTHTPTTIIHPIRPTPPARRARAEL